MTALACPYENAAVYIHANQPCSSSVERSSGGRGRPWEEPRRSLGGAKEALGRPQGCPWEEPRRPLGGAKEVLRGSQGGPVGEPRSSSGGAEEALGASQGAPWEAPRRPLGGAKELLGGAKELLGGNQGGPWGEPRRPLGGAEGALGRSTTFGPPLTQRRRGSVFRHQKTQIHSNGMMDLRVVSVANAPPLKNSMGRYTFTSLGS